MIAPAYEEAARRLLATSQDGAAVEATAAARVCQDLVAFLSRFIGESGARALFHRSLVLARRDHPWLAEPTPRDESVWPRLSASMEAHGSEASDASIALLATFIHLLATFVGTHLAFQILHQHRPEAFPLGPSTESA